MHNEPALEKLILTNNPSITMSVVVVFTITLLQKVKCRLGINHPFKLGIDLYYSARQELLSGLFPKQDGVLDLFCFCCLNIKVSFEPY